MVRFVREGPVRFRVTLRWAIGWARREFFMLHALFTAVIASLAVGGEVAIPEGTQLSFRGSVEARAEDADKPRKAFELTLWILRADESGAQVAWLVDERGRGEFPWTERFGRLGVDAGWRSGADGPAVLYDRGEGRNVVAVPLPFLKSDKPLAAGDEFRDGKLEFHVDKPTKTAGQASWQISVRDPFGPKRMLWVDAQRPLLLALTERLTMGRGEEYQLRLELVASERLEGETLAALSRAFDKLLAVRAKLGTAPRTQEVAWKEDQLSQLRDQLPGVEEAAAGTPLAPLATTARRDLTLQSGRNDAVSELGNKFVGRAVEDFSAKGPDDAQLSRAELEGRVTVLHFWDYRDEPLKEPYGQVGYLDFLFHRRKAAGVQVFGVAVDGRLADEKTRGAAERSVRKLKSFMNLSYPILLDGGPLLKQFGDPRLVGASLPLFVVIGPDGKIVHYRVGHYEVHQDQGLKELDQVIGKALEARKP